MGWFSNKDRDTSDHIHESIQLGHEKARHNYERRQVIKANEERRRKGLPLLPVPPGDWR